MQLQVKAQHGHLPASTRAYAEKRFSKLGKRLHDLTLVEVTFSQEHNPSIAANHVAEAVVYTKGPNIVARVSAASYEAAIDQVLEKLERQVERYRDKRTHEPRRQAQRRKEAAHAAPPDELRLEPSDDATASSQ